MAAGIALPVGTGRKLYRQSKFKSGDILKELSRTLDSTGSEVFFRYLFFKLLTETNRKQNMIFNSYEC